LNWAYKTTPQHQLRGQEIDYSRGKGLGGTTSINFCAWTVGPRDDYDEWARIAGDEKFGWRNAEKCLRRIENLHPKIPSPDLKSFFGAKLEGKVLSICFCDRLSTFCSIPISDGLNIRLTLYEDHSASGPLHLTYGKAWRHDIGDIFVAAEQSGFGTNEDVNSGNPLGKLMQLFYQILKNKTKGLMSSWIGMGIAPLCIHNDQRQTAAMAYLAKPPANLTIICESLV
jgi:choline dehydrogenase-like flavoprotein